MYITWISKQYQHLINYYFLYNTSLYKPLSGKLKFLITAKPTPHTVFNQQASDWVHCEEEMGAHTGIARQTYKLAKFLPHF